jgi:hypothetical protein
MDSTRNNLHMPKHYTKQGPQVTTLGQKIYDAVQTNICRCMLVVDERKPGLGDNGVRCSTNNLEGRMDFAGNGLSWAQWIKLFLRHCLLFFQVRQISQPGGLETACSDNGDTDIHPPTTSGQQTAEVLSYIAPSSEHQWRASTPSSLSSSNAVSRLRLKSPVTSRAPPQASHNASGVFTVRVNKRTLHISGYPRFLRSTRRNPHNNASVVGSCVNVPLQVLTTM